jgi:hypothetical protein
MVRVRAQLGRPAQSRTQMRWLRNRRRLNATRLNRLTRLLAASVGPLLR